MAAGYDTYYGRVRVRPVRASAARGFERPGGIERRGGIARLGGFARRGGIDGGGDGIRSFDEACGL